MRKNKPLTLSCIESKPGHEQAVSCQQVLAVCTFQVTAHPKLKKNVIWAAENMPLSPLIAYLGRIGFEFPQTT